MTLVLLGLGSNIDREHHLVEGVHDLRKAFGRVQVSPVYESPALGFDGPPFFNAVAAVETGLTPGQLLTALRRIEEVHGRDPGQKKYASRTLDIDILCYGDAVGEHDGILLPRPEVLERAFVLKPLADLMPDSVCPGRSETWLQLWQAFAGDRALRTVPLAFS